MDLSRYLIHPGVRCDATERARQLGFMLGHAGGAGVAAALVLAVLSRLDPVPLSLWAASTWLVASPLGVALLLRATGRLELAQTASVINLALVIFILTVLTGGLASPLVPWFALVPFEAALSGRRRLIAVAVLLSVLAVAGLGFLDLRGLSPAFMQTDGSMAPLLQVAGLISAVLYAGLTAAAAQSAQRVLTRMARADEERYRVLTEYAMDLIMRFGRDGRIKFASPAAMDVLGKTPDELVGHSISEFVSGADRREVQSALARTSYFGSETTLEFRIRTADDRKLWVEMRCRPLLAHRDTDKDSAIVRWGEGASKEGAQVPAAAFETVAVIRDVTERKRVEEALLRARDEAEAANRAKSRFLANMSHELRTPLNAIIGFSEMMMAELFGPLGNHRYVEYASHVKESGEHLRDVINDVLDMSKIEAGRFDIELESVSVPKVIEESLKTVSVTAKQKKVKLDVDLAQGLPRLRADRRAVKQMLLNLLANAIKFTPADGLVTAAARVVGNEMVLEVRDTGIGIPAEALPRLGSPFEQVAKAMRGGDVAVTGDPGTGLGLALVKAFAELHDGAMEIESEAGTGTSVRIRLPLEGPAGRGDDEAKAAAPIDLNARRRVA